MRQCQSCAVPISENRLKAVPSATHCVVCQEFEDTKMQLIGHRGMNRVGAAGKFESDDSIMTRYRGPRTTHGLSGAVAGGHGF